MIWAVRKDDAVFCRLISRALGVEEDEGPAVVESVLVSFRGEANLWHIREFRTPDGSTKGWPGM